MITWTEQSKAEGRAEGLAEGRVEGQVAVIVKLARQRFGESSASAMAALLESVTSEAVLDKVASWLLTCDSEDALLAKIQKL